MVTRIPPLRRRRGHKRVALEPLSYRKVIKLLRPQQPRKRLAHHPTALDRKVRGNDAGIEFIGLASAIVKHLLKLRSKLGARSAGGYAESKLYDSAFPGFDREPIVRRGLGAAQGGVDRVVLAVNDIPVESVFNEWRCVRRAKDPLVVRLVIGKERLSPAFE